MHQRPPIYGAAVALCLAFAHPAGAAPSAVLYVGVHGGGGRNLHTVEVLAPILRRGGNLWFADLRGASSSADTQEYNLGFGLRHLVTRRGVLGAYAYYDHRRAYGHFFDQATVGMEWLGRRFDLRANVYLPFSPPRFLGTGTPYLAETGVAINRDYAEALHGFDLEGGLLVPGVSRYVETRAYAGIYRFFGIHNKNVSGWRARVEFWLTRGVYAEVDRRDDNLRGPQTIASLNLYVPLNRHFLRNLADVFNPRPNAVRTLRERMLQPPIRDVDIQTAAYAQAQVIQPLLYVDPAPPGGGIGTLSRPITDLQKAIDAAGPGTWVRVGSGTYAGPLTVPADVTLWGAGISAFGIPAGPAPVIRSPGPADAVTITSPLPEENPLQGADPAVVMGLAATGADANHAGFRITGSGATLIADRTYGNGIGIAVDHTGAGAQSVSIRDTLAYRNTWFGLRARNPAGAGTQSLAVAGSTFTANGLGGIWADNQAGATQIVDLGGGSLGSAGGNRIFGNTVYDLANDSGGTLSARGDWWGQPGGPQTFAYAAPGGLTAGAGAVTDTSGALSTDPGTFTATPVQSPLVFVDDARAGTVRDGTYTHPYAGVQNAVNTAGPRGTVFVAPGASAYTGNITMTLGSTLWGAGYRNLGLGTAPTSPFGPGSAAPRLFASSGTTITAASGSTVQGVSIFGSNTLLSIRDVTNVKMYSDRFSGVGYSHPVSIIQSTTPVLAVFAGDSFLGGSFQVSASSSGTAPMSLTFQHDEFGAPTAPGFFGIFAGLSRGDTLLFAHNTFQTTFAGVWNSFGGTLDFGGGPLGSPGINRFLTYSQSGYAIGQSRGASIFSEKNWWGQTLGPTPTEFNGGAVSSYHVSPWLTTDPGP